MKIPAGVADGMRVRLAAQGEVGPGGDRPAISTSRFTNSRTRSTSATATTCTVSVPMHDAALGTTVTVEDILEGDIEITVCPGPSRVR